MCSITRLTTAPPGQPMSLFDPVAADRRTRVGVLTHGSLGAGVEMKLDPARSVESVRAGTFVVVEGEAFDFF